jgi:uncharacterized protein YndB with AHSA1/START domain/DNA-binding transcriptional ArsR family regulator
MEKIWKALSDKSRRRILDLLREKELTTGEICKHFKKMTRYGVMKHLTILHDADLIIVKREGKNRINYINPLPIQHIYERWVKKYEAGWSSYLIKFKNHMEGSEMEKIKFTVATRIEKPITEVFKAFTDNNILDKYFVSSASAPIKAVGDKIAWSWGKEKTEITVTEFVENKSVAFTWPAHKANYNTNCRFDFEEVDGKTRVVVTEEGWKTDEEGINSSHSNNNGWTHMLLSMKAWLTHGIDLRK